MIKAVEIELRRLIDPLKNYFVDDSCGLSHLGRRRILIDDVLQLGADLTPR